MTRVTVADMEGFVEAVVRAWDLVDYSPCSSCYYQRDCPHHRYDVEHKCPVYPAILRRLKERR